MLLLLILIASEFLTFLVFRHHYKGTSRTGYYISTITNAILSCFLWILYVEVSSFKGDFDDPGHIWLMMSLTGAYCAILVPRVVLNILHYTGKLIVHRKGVHIRSLTNTGIIIWIAVLIVVSAGTLAGRFRFTTEEVNIKSEKLNKSGSEITIVQISDLHLAGFQRHKNLLLEVMEKINSYNPDIIINTGDFVSYGWKEFDRCDTILSVAKSRLGKYAILGNHDIGTYHPDYGTAERDTNVARLSALIRSSGYTLLNDANCIIEADSLRIGLAGVLTRGRRLQITYGDLDKALSGLDSVDYTILMSHDPNHFDKDISGKRRVDLTLSGHTHGMQVGIVTRWFKWSPSRFFHPKWSGLYASGDQHLYVNRGLGVLAIPFRIGMPPEITVIRLSGTR